MNEAIEEAFRFLVAEHSFNLLTEGDSVVYASPRLEVRLTFTPDRDGYGSQLSFPQLGPQAVCIGTLLGALAPDDAVLGEPPYWPADGAQRDAAFVAANLDRLCDMPLPVYRDCCALEFSPSPKWRKRWGAAIAMSPLAIIVEWARLSRLREYFGCGDA